MSLPFDPRLAPLEALPDSPSVPAQRLTVGALRERFANPPPWQVDVEIERSSMMRETVSAAVLVPLISRAYLGDDNVQVLLTQRTAHLRSHGGQISFPGGRAEAVDVDEVATALREAHEEVGLPAERVEILGQMPVFVTGTGFAVTPVVGLVHAHAHEAQALSLRPDPQEVAGVFEVPLSFLMNPANHQRHRVQLAQLAFSYYAMPWRGSQAGSEYFIWGATAGMLRNLYKMLSA